MIVDLRFLSNGKLTEAPNLKSQVSNPKSYAQKSIE